MRIAFISDIHSNVDALKETLIDIRDRAVDKIYCLGDLIGYHLYPNEVIELIKSENIETVMGNHEYDILNKKFDRNKESDIAKYFNFDSLKKENLEFIKNLDFEKIRVEDSIKIKMVHASPRKINEYIFEDGDNVKEIVSELKEDLLVCAHTHYPYIKNLNGKIIINTGSIGKPKIGRPNSSYVLFDTKTKTGEIIEVVYDFEKLAKELEIKNFPQNYSDLLRTGIDK